MLPHDRPVPPTHLLAAARDHDQRPAQGEGGTQHPIELAHTRKLRAAGSLWHMQTTGCAVVAAPSAPHAESTHQQLTWALLRPAMPCTTPAQKQAPPRQGPLFHGRQLRLGRPGSSGSGLPLPKLWETAAC